jgi:cbb3-type cytochrome oxidase subunit 3
VISLLKWGPWIALGLAVTVAGVCWALMRGAQGQRDAARAEKAAADLTAAVYRASAKTAADAAERLGADIKENDLRCGAAIAAVRKQADGYRLALRQCPTAEALGKRLGVLFP